MGIDEIWWESDALIMTLHFFAYFGPVPSINSLGPHIMLSINWNAPFGVFFYLEP